MPANEPSPWLLNVGKSSTLLLVSVTGLRSGTTSLGSLVRDFLDISSMSSSKSVDGSMSTQLVIYTVSVAMQQHSEVYKYRNAILLLNIKITK